MYEELRTYDLRESRALVMGEDTDAGLMMRFIEAVLSDREYELDGMFALHCDIIVNDSIVKEYLTVDEIVGELRGLINGNFVTVHVTDSGKMTIVCYDVDGITDRIVVD